MRTISFAAALVASAQATHIIWNPDVPAEEFRVDHADYPFAFPWPAGNPYCGGSLVSPQHMITAAHCVEHGAVPFTIEHRGNRYRVTEQRPLKCYTDKADEGFDIQFPADIAVLVLEEPVPNAEPGVDYLELWDVEKYGDMQGKVFTLIGWGLSGPIGSNYDGSMSVLHRAENVVDTIEDNTLIYGMTRPDQGGRRLEGIGNSGDSGSPAIIRNPDTGRWNIGGVKSWGMGFGWESTNGYTRLGGIASNWVNQNISFASDGTPNEWFRIDDDKCELFEPDGYTDYSENSDDDGDDGSDGGDGGDNGGDAPNCYECDWSDYTCWYECEYPSDDGDDNDGGDDVLPPPSGGDDDGDDGEGSGDASDGGNAGGGGGCNCTCTCECDCDKSSDDDGDMPPPAGGDGEDDMPPAGGDGETPNCNDCDWEDDECWNACEYPDNEDDMPPAGGDDEEGGNEGGDAPNCYDCDWEDDECWNACEYPDNDDDMPPAGGDDEEEGGEGSKDAPDCNDCDFDDDDCWANCEFDWDNDDEGTAGGDDGIDYE